uniref:Serum response factor-binding protein 1 n=1 Tax=Nothobranchius korthausae TaxID=1143690 RepID=A0A1A8GUC5_9TELE
MMNTEEKRLPPVEDEQKDVKEEEDDEEETINEGEKSSDFDDEEDEKEEESPRFPVDEMIPSPTRDEEEKKKQPDVLNLNNEVVKMRKEVKRIKALIIRKQTRQIAALKKKKGKEADVERNQRRAERLLEEVHCMKKLLPDLVTKTALQKNLNFEQVCKNPKATLSDRAVARIATHPQFNKKIESIKAAVKSFKEEHMKGGKLRGNAKCQKPLGNATVPSPDTTGGEKTQEKQKDKAVKLEKDSEEGVSLLQIPEDRSLDKTVGEMEKTPDAVNVHEEDAAEPASVRSPSVKSPSKKEKPQSEAEEKSSDLRSSALLHKEADEEESDIESSDNEEREYFDDSTEERFRRQSSQSEESDDDDFFLGKVSKFKRKQHLTDTGGEKKNVDKGQEEKKGSTDIVRTPDKLQSELDELESRLKSKAAALQTIFCSSLAGPKTGRGSERGRGRGGCQFKGQHDRGTNRDYFSKQLKSQQQEKGPSVSGSNSKPCPEKDGRGRGRGRGVQRHKDHRGGHVSAHQPPLHPSWEASKKRKEQQGQILAFQGKKIKFDDD